MNGYLNNRIEQFTEHLCARVYVQAHVAFRGPNLPGIPARFLAEAVLCRLLAEYPFREPSVLKAVYGRSGSSAQRCRTIGPAGCGVDCSALSPRDYHTVTNLPHWSPWGSGAKFQTRQPGCVLSGCRPSTRCRFYSATPDRSQPARDTPLREDCRPGCMVIMERRLRVRSDSPDEGAYRP